MDALGQYDMAYVQVGDFTVIGMDPDENNGQDFAY
jgi:hypothetical protein